MPPSGPPIKPGGDRRTRLTGERRALDRGGRRGVRRRRYLDVLDVCEREQHDRSVDLDHEVLVLHELLDPLGDVVAPPLLRSREREGELRAVREMDGQTPV